MTLEISNVSCMLKTNKLKGCPFNQSPEEELGIGLYVNNFLVVSTFDFDTFSFPLRHNMRIEIGHELAIKCGKNYWITGTDGWPRKRYKKFDIGRWSLTKCGDDCVLGYNCIWNPRMKEVFVISYRLFVIQFVKVHRRILDIFFSLLIQFSSVH